MSNLCYAIRILRQIRFKITEIYSQGHLAVESSLFCLSNDNVSLMFVYFP